MQTKRQRLASQKGGNATLKNRGIEHFINMGKKGGAVGAGGRPRLKTLNELLALRLESNNEIEGGKFN